MKMAHMGLSFFVLLFASSSSFAEEGIAGGSKSTSTWVDPVVESGVTPIKAVHINQMRQLIDSKRASCGLAVGVWTDNPIVPKQTAVKKIHLEELRLATRALVEAAIQSGSSTKTNDRNLSSVNFTNPEVVAKQTAIRAVHLNELKSILDTVDCTVTAGACGAAHGGTFESAPTAALCTEGKASAVVRGTTTRRVRIEGVWEEFPVPTNEWVWTCVGARSASCKATYIPPLPGNRTCTSGEAPIAPGPCSDGFTRTNLVTITDTCPNTSRGSGSPYQRYTWRCVDPYGRRTDACAVTNYRPCNQGK